MIFSRSSLSFGERPGFLTNFKADHDEKDISQWVDSLHVEPDGSLQVFISLENLKKNFFFNFADLGILYGCNFGKIQSKIILHHSEILYLAQHCARMPDQI